MFLDTNENIFLASNLAHMAKILCKNVLLLSWVAVDALVDSFVEKRSSGFKARDHAVDMSLKQTSSDVMAQYKDISSLHVSEEKNIKNEVLV